jgi:hypothetical protein
MSLSLVIREPIQTPQITTEKLFASELKGDTLHLKATSNQAAFGTNKEVTFNVDTTNVRTISFPSPPSNAQVVLSEGAQTINGSKTFSNLVVFLSGFSLAAMTLSGTSNQLTLGAGNTIILNAPTPAATRTYGLPDVGANANFVMTEGNQTINGVKTFTSPFALSSLSLSASSNQLVLGTGNTVTVTAPSPAASRTYTLPDVGSAAHFVLTEGNQTINGVKTFTSAPALSGLSLSYASLVLSQTTNQLVLGSGSTLTLTAPTPVASLTYMIPDVGAPASFVMTEGNQLVHGTKTFANAPNLFGLSLSFASLELTDALDQILFGAGDVITVTAPTPAMSVIYTIPDVGLDASFVMTEGLQTINGSKTFSDAITFSVAPILSGLSLLFASQTLTDTSNQFVLGSGQTITLSAPTPAASRTYSMSDVGSNASFVMTEGAQTINGVKTFSSAPVFPALSFASLALTAVSNQLVLGTGNTFTITGPTPSSSRTFTLPDVGNSSFVMTNGAQTINSQKTFALGLFTTQTSNQIVLGSTNTTTITCPPPAASRIYTISDAGTNASFVMTQGTQTINGVKTFTSAPILTNLGLSFASLTLTNTSNQIVLNLATLSIDTPAASRTYSLADPGANASFVMTEGNQTLNGSKTFSSVVTVSSTANQLVFGTGNTITLSAPSPSASRTYTMPDVGSDAKFVMTEGDQGIFGQKTFFRSILMNEINSQLIFQPGGGSQVIIVQVPSSPSATRTYNIPDVGGPFGPTADFVMTLGTQTMGGLKTFSDTVTISKNFSNQLVIGSAPFATTINVFSNGLTYSIDDAGANASFVMTEGFQTIHGQKRFTEFELIHASPGITFQPNGTGNSVRVFAQTPAASVQYLLPDIGGNSSFLMAAGAQNITGTKTFLTAPVLSGLSLSYSALSLTNTTNQIVLGTTNTTTITSPAPAASRMYTIPDAGGAASFVMTQGTQTINGAKTLSNATVSFPTSGGTPAALNYYETFTSTIDFKVPWTLGVNTVNISFTRIGNLVTMRLQGFISIADFSPTAASSIDSTSAIPARFRPIFPDTVQVYTTVENVATTLTGIVFIHASGVINIFRLTVNGVNVEPNTFQGSPPQTSYGFTSCYGSWLTA